MRKIKLLMMLTLLCLGLSSAWAQGGTTTWLDESDHTKGFTDGILEYSTQFEHRPRGTVDDLSSKGEVAVRLHLDATKTLQDLVISPYNGTATTFTRNGTTYQWYVYLPGYDARNRNETHNDYYIMYLTSLDATTGMLRHAYWNESDVLTSEYTEGVNLDGYTFTGTDGATYKWAGRLSTATDNQSQRRFFFERTLENFAYSTATNVDIPSTISAPDGTTYTVSSIQQYGFCWEEYIDCQLTFCSEDGQELLWSYPNDHKNDMLETVTFPNTLTYIGDYAFMGCEKLTSVVLPSNLEHLGTDGFGGVFEACTSLSDVRFNENSSKITVLPMYTFWLCTALNTLELPDGLVTIENSACQYLKSLRSITIPSTVTTIGDYFLFLATNLTRLTVPASVTSIGGGFLSGCESLTEVYLFGEYKALVASLEALAGEKAPFAYNERGCGDEVTNCTFYVPEAYLNNPNPGTNDDDYYDTHNAWKIATEDASRNNSYKPLDNYCTFSKKWQTAIFPQGASNYKTDFGNNTKVAIMNSVKAEWDTDNKLLLTLDFQLQSAADIPANIPVLIYPSNDNVRYNMYDASALTDGPDGGLAFRTLLSTGGTNEKNTEVNDPNRFDGATITCKVIMKGIYTNDNKGYWNFYLKQTDATNDEYKFFAVRPGNTVKVSAYRCYWHVSVGGVKINPEDANFAKQLKDLWDETNGIREIMDEVKVQIGVYDLQGRRQEISPEDLPQGLFIVNGKKLFVK